MINKFKFSCPNGSNSTLEKKDTCFVYRRPGHHAPQWKHKVKNNNPLKVDIAKREDIIIVFVSQVRIITNVNKWMVGRLWD